MICRFGIRLLVRDRLEIARKMAALERRFLRGEMCRVRVGKKYIKDTPMLTHDQQAKTASGLRKYSNSNEIRVYSQITLCPTPNTPLVSWIQNIKFWNRMRVLSLIRNSFSLLRCRNLFLFCPCFQYWPRLTSGRLLQPVLLSSPHLRITRTKVWFGYSAYLSFNRGSPGPRFGLAIQLICLLIADHPDEGLVWLLNWFVHYWEPLNQGLVWLFNWGPLGPRFGWLFNWLVL